jgi:hypothetical protein
MEILDLENPIFAFYVPVGNMSPAKEKEKIHEFSRNFRYENVTCWIFPIKEGNPRVELVYPGRKENKVF